MTNRTNNGVVAPFDRNKLSRRNAIERDDELASAAQRSPEQGFIETLELCEVVRQLAAATGANVPGQSLAEKARFYVRPLEAAQR